METIADKIRILQKERGVPLYTLAKEIGVASTTLYSLFKKGKDPQLATCLKLAKFFGVPPQVLCDDDFCVDERSDELLLLDAFGRLCTEDRAAVLAYAKSLVNPAAADKE